MRSAWERFYLRMGTISYRRVKENELLSKNSLFSFPNELSIVIASQPHAIGKGTRAILDRVAQEEFVE